MEVMNPLEMPFWQLISPSVSTELSEIISKHDNQLHKKQTALEIINTKWSNHLCIFTDGSKSPESGRAAAAFYVSYYNYSQSKRLQDNSSSYRAELAAIALALEWLRQLPSLHTGVVVCSDSLSSLQSIQNGQMKEDTFVNEILILCTHLNWQGIVVNFEWIPSHCGIKDNEIVRIFSDRGSVQIPIKYSKNVKRGVLRTTFHQPEVFINIITGSVGDKETLTPEYKVVAVDFERI